MLHNFSYELLRLMAVFLFFCFSLSGQIIDPLLQSIMDRASEAENIPIFIMLNQQPDRIAIQAEISGMSKRDKKEYIIQSLKQFSSETQQNILTVLMYNQQNGQVSHIRQLWIVNGIGADAVKSVIKNISTYQEVRTIRYDPVIPSEKLSDEITSETSTELWNLERINAPLVWSIGFSGQGVLIAMLDTGIDYNHPDLSDHMWDGSGQFFEYKGNIYELIHHGFDFSDGDNDPMDESGHGTSTAGIAAGDGTGGTKTGVAPDATIMAVRISPGSETNIMEGIQFAIDFGADIISMSKSIKFNIDCIDNSFISSPDYPSWRQCSEWELIMGVFHANSTGNEGEYSECTRFNIHNYYPIPYNIAAPANCPASWLHPDQFIVGGLSSIMAVGATDQNDEILDYSGLGPAAWEDITINYTGYPYPIPQEYWDYQWDNGNQMGLIKPDVSAPSEVTTTEKGGGYRNNFGGTSAATPHVGGSAALLLSAFPQLTPKYLSSVLQSTAVDYPPTGKDNRYGAGRIDVYASYQLILASPSTPTGLKVTKYGSNPGNPKLSWSANTEADLKGYNIYRKLPGQFWVEIAFVETPTTYYIDYEVAWGGKWDPDVCYRITAVDIINNESSFTSQKCAPFGGIQKELVSSSDLPSEFVLDNNFPNPFNPVTEIRYQLSIDSKVNLSIYNVLGQKIRTLINYQKPANYYSVIWNGKDDLGKSVSSGMYFYRLQAISLEDGQTFSQTKKMVLLR